MAKSPLRPSRVLRVLCVKAFLEGIEVPEGFREGFVEADGFRIRYMEGGEGPAHAHLHGAGGLRLSPAHDLLAKQFRVVAFEMPGFGASAENTKTQSMPELAATMAAAADQLGLDRFNLMGTSFGGKAALSLALQQPERVLALILESPAAIRQKGARPSSGTPEERRSEERRVGKECRCGGGRRCC